MLAMRTLMPRRFTSLTRPPCLSHHRELSHFRVIEHIIPASWARTYPGATEQYGRDPLSLAVKQYVPLKGSSTNSTAEPVTIIGGHANGFPKEMYEALWDDMYDELQSHQQQIRSIWVADFVNQGQSGVLNEAELGNDPNWWDHVRDLLFLINQKQSQMKDPLIGIGHSMGASVLAGVSMLHPSLFQALALIDPVIQIENPSREFAPPSTHRRDHWPSHQAATQAFAKSKFYQAWDKRVLNKWFKFGLRPSVDHLPVFQSNQSPAGETEISRDAALHDSMDDVDLHDGRQDVAPVVLTTTKAQEVFHYLRPLYKVPSASLDLRQRIYPDVNSDDLEPDYDFYRPEPAELCRRLPEVRPSTMYVFGRTSPVSTPVLRKQKIDTTGIGIGGSGGASKGRVKEIVLESGHMVPFETPTACAQHIAQWISHEVSRWQSTRDEWTDIWNQSKHKQNIDDEWLQRVPKPEKRLR